MADKEKKKLETIPNEVELFVSVRYWDCPACFLRQQEASGGHGGKAGMVHCNQCGRNYEAIYEA